MTKITIENKNITKHLSELNEGDIFTNGDYFYMKLSCGNRQNVFNLSESYVATLDPSEIVFPVNAELIIH